MRNELGGLSEFFWRATDFAALSSANNILSSLSKTGCQHFKEFLKKAFSFDAPDLSTELPKEVATGVKRFIRDFWAKHGRSDARRLAESRGSQI